MRYCVVKACPNRKRKPESTVHVFPNIIKKPMLRQTWTDLAVDPSERNEILIDHYGVCSMHFLDEAYEIGAEKRRRLKPLATPAVNLSQNGVLPPSELDILKIKIEELSQDLERCKALLTKRDQVKSIFKEVH